MVETGPLRNPHPEWDIEIKVQGPPGNLGVILNEIGRVVDKHSTTLDYFEVTAVPVPRKGTPCEINGHDWYHHVDGERTCRVCPAREQVL